MERNKRMGFRRSIAPRASPRSPVCLRDSQQISRADANSKNVTGPGTGCAVPKTNSGIVDDLTAPLCLKRQRSVCALCRQVASSYRSDPYLPVDTRRRHRHSVAGHDPGMPIAVQFSCVAKTRISADLRSTKMGIDKRGCDHHGKTWRLSA